MRDLKFSEIKEICEITGLAPTELRNVFDESFASDWLLLTDDEAEARVKDCISEMVWAFNPVFLSSETELPVEVFQAIQDNDLCESNNSALLAIVRQTCGLESLAESAIQSDGRGHFLSPYDGVEHEINSDLYLYRVN